MGLGILDDPHLTHVPGTTLFRDDPSANALAQFTKHVGTGKKLEMTVNLGQLKHAKGKNSHIVLVPQPSDDPNDPLNWPAWKKHLVFFVLLYGTILCGGFGPLVNVDLVGIAKELDRSLQAVTRAVGAAFHLPLGISTLVWSALSFRLGKRPVYLLSTLFMFTSSMIGAYTADYNMLLGSRILSGISVAVLEFLIGASVADIYFTHERGIPVALLNMAFVSGTSVTPAVSGQIIGKLGWRFCFKLFSIASGLLFILMFFLVPETTFQRFTTQPEDLFEDYRAKDPESPESVPGIRKKSYRQELKIYNGIYPSKMPFLQSTIRPLISCVTPICLWAGLLYGFAITWAVLISTSVDQIFSAKPYFFSAPNVGLTFLSPFIGSILAALLCGPMSNFAAKRMSKLNGGIYEPEFRLVLVIPYVIFASIGYFGWGISASLKEPWISPVVFLGVIYFSITVGCSAAVGYVVDSYRQSSNSALGSIIFFKNVFSTIVTLFDNDWIRVRGILNVFCIVGGITIFTSLLTIPMYMYGKRARSWIHRTIHFDDSEGGVVPH